MIRASIRVYRTKCYHINDMNCLIFNQHFLFFCNATQTFNFSFLHHYRMRLSDKLKRNRSLFYIVLTIYILFEYTAYRHYDFIFSNSQNGRGVLFFELLQICAFTKVRKSSSSLFSFLQLNLVKRYLILLTYM